MVKYYTQTEINRLITGREATLDKIYLMADGTSYVGTKDKTIRLRTRAEETVIQNTNIFETAQVVSSPLTELINVNDVKNGNNVFTYDADKNLVQIKVYSDSLLTTLLSTKTLLYYEDGNIQSIKTVDKNGTLIKNFSFNLDGDLTNKTIT